MLHNLGEKWNSKRKGNYIRPFPSKQGPNIHFRLGTSVNAEISLESRFARHVCRLSDNIVWCWWWTPTWHRMDRCSWSRGLFSKTTSSRYVQHKIGRPLILSILSCVRAHMIRNPMKLHSVEGTLTYDFTLHLRVRVHTTLFWRCVGMAFGHFLFGSHNFMVTALGSCVKWSIVSK